MIKSLSFLFILQFLQVFSTSTKEKVEEKIAETGKSLLDEAIHYGVAYFENFLKKTLYEMAFFGIIILVLAIGLVYAMKSGGSTASTTATPARKRTRTTKAD